MQIALLLAREIAQLFLILLAGFVLVRAGLLRAADSKVLSVILVYLVIPCVIVDAFQIEDTPAIRAGLALSFGAAAAIHLLFLLLTWLLRRPLGLDAIERATAIYSNAGALVIPLVQALLGQEYVIYSCAFIIVQLVLLWTHGAAILRGAGALSWKAVLTNVNLLSILAGAALYLGHIPLPALLTTRPPTSTPAEITGLNRSRKWGGVLGPARMSMPSLLKVFTMLVKSVVSGGYWPGSTRV